MTTRFSARGFGAFVLVAIGGATFLPLGCGSSSSTGLQQSDSGVTPAADTDAGEDSTDAGFLDGGGLLNDADIDAGFGCTTTPKGPGPLHRTCRAATTNECDGLNEDASLPNGANGNGFDDDCDGLVDEGCSCGSPGTTKDCFLVPPSQTSNVTHKPVGWCTENAKGSVACVRQGEFSVWGGTCRGAQPPFATDKCARGDFDCDGEDQNPTGVDCSCKSDLVQCPTAPFVTAPYPPPSALPLKIDAKDWLVDPNLLSQASGWKWTLRGGDCDNIAPSPSFALFPTAVGSGTPPGSVVTNIGAGNNEKGRQVTQAGGVSNVVYPAFSLSGDYILDMEVTVQGQPYKCSSKIEVRAPGLRAEACWDTMGNTDVDLHMAKVNGYSSCAHPGWSDSCASEDCLWSNCKSDQAGMSRWYAASPTTACVGWGSLASSACPNPRLDRDNISCVTTEQNPNGTSSPLPFPFPFPIPASSNFCGSENINVDNPTSGDTFAVGTVLYSGASAKPHINVYCNGQRIVSAGYNPLNGSNFPVLRESGGDNGDFWKFGLVKVTGSGANIACDVTTTKSVTPIGNKDGSTSFCVDKGAANSTTYLSRSGGTPSVANDLCFH